MNNQLTNRMPDPSEIRKAIVKAGDIIYGEKPDDYFGYLEYLESRGNKEKKLIDLYEKLMSKIIGASVVAAILVSSRKMNKIEWGDIRFGAQGEFDTNGTVIANHLHKLSQQYIDAKIDFWGFGSPENNLVLFWSRVMNSYENYCSEIILAMNLDLKKTEYTLQYNFIQDYFIKEVNEDSIKQTFWFSKFSNDDFYNEDDKLKDSADGFLFNIYEAIQVAKSILFN